MIPKEIAEQFSNGEKTWAGTNQTMRMIDKGTAKIILIGEDVKPKELIKPVEAAAKDHGIEVHYGTKAEIGKIAGCPRPTATACICKFEPYSCKI